MGQRTVIGGCGDRYRYFNDQELTCFEKHLKDILEDCRPTSVKIVYCDCEIQSVDYFDQPNEMKFHPKGGGGTDMTKIVQWCHQNADEPIDCCLIFTDGYTPYPSEKEIGDLNLFWIILPSPHRGANGLKNRN